MPRTSILFALCLLLIANRGTLGQSTQEGTGKPEKIVKTTVYVEDIHCKHCARKLARKLFTVPGVKSVRANVPKDFAQITPQEKKQVSPEKLWKAAEAAGFKVLKIVGPKGTLDKKPVTLAQEKPGTTGG